MGRFLAVYSLLFLLAFEFAEGILRPVLTSYVQHHIESYRRATILSVKNMSRALSIAIIAPLIGAIADYWSIQTAFIVTGIILAAYAVILAVVFLIFRK
jgi:sugar phosphate permease